VNAELEPNFQRSQLLAALLDEAREPVLALDANGTIVHANLAAATALGRMRAHLVGKPLAALVELESRPPLRRALAGVDLEADEVEVSFVGGQRRRVTLRAVIGVQPRVVAAALAAPGTGRAPAPAPLPVRPPRGAGLAAVLDRYFVRLPLAVVGIDADGRILFANPQARRLLGDTIRIGRTFAPPTELKEITHRLLTAPSVVTSRRVELGDRIVRVFGVGAARYEPALLLLDDVTKTRREAQVMRDFLRNAAHQLRTPLTGIAAAAEVLQGGAKNDPEQLDRFLTHIDTHARRLTRIARGLLVLARAESGEPLRIDIVRVAPLLEELAREATPAPGVTVTVECEPTLAAVADPDLAHEAIGALVENAVEHTRRGAIRLEAAATDGGVLVSVTDNGGGILPEHRERVFEPFYRPAAGGAGFGLGLAIAAQAVKAMGGELTVEDAGGGSRFIVRLRSGSPR
jgi:signal transduction histidine kinase